MTGLRRTRRARESAANIARSRTRQIRSTDACGRGRVATGGRPDRRENSSDCGTRGSSSACGCWAGTCASRMASSVRRDPSTPDRGWGWGGGARRCAGSLRVAATHPLITQIATRFTPDSNSGSRAGESRSLRNFRAPRLHARSVRALASCMRTRPALRSAAFRSIRPARGSLPRPRRPPTRPASPRGRPTADLAVLHNCGCACGKP